MINVMEADIPGHPLQGLRQFQIGRAVQRRRVKIPFRRAQPMGIVETVPHRKQPDAGNRRQEYDRQLH
jgi:hypothetical protein